MGPAAIAEDQALYEEWYESSLSTRIPRRLQCGQEETGDVFAEEDDKVRSKHESCKLKWAGKRGADEYKKGMQKEGVTVRLKTIQRHSATVLSLHCSLIHSNYLNDHFIFSSKRC